MLTNKPDDAQGRLEVSSPLWSWFKIPESSLSETETGSSTTQCLLSSAVKTLQLRPLCSLLSILDILCTSIYRWSTHMLFNCCTSRRFSSTESVKTASIWHQPVRQSIVPVVGGNRYLVFYSIRMIALICFHFDSQIYFSADFVETHFSNCEFCVKKKSKTNLSSTWKERNPPFTDRLEETLQVSSCSC